MQKVYNDADFIPDGAMERLFCWLRRIEHWLSHWLTFRKMLPLFLGPFLYIAPSCLLIPDQDTESFDVVFRTTHAIMCSFVNETFSAQSRKQ